MRALLLSHQAVRRLVTFASMIALSGLAEAGERTAEFAVRWRSVDGGPASLQEIGNLFKIQGEPVVLNVRYFVVSQSLAPASPAPILRERTSQAKTDVTWKIRSATDWDKTKSNQWCPLVGKVKSKEEVDVTVRKGNALKRTFSRSCTVKSSIDAALPKEMTAIPQGCKARVTRLESPDEVVTIEQWAFDGDPALYLEVSMKGEDSKQLLKAFKSSYVSPRLSAGVIPLDSSKTQLGTSCK